MTIENKCKNIDEYISSFPPDVQKIMVKLRKVIKDTAPGLEEVISWDMPTFKYKGKNLIHFAGYKKHIGLYPAPTAILEFKKELAGYKQGKGSVQFPLNKPFPYDIVIKIVKFRTKELIKQEK